MRSTWIILIAMLVIGAGMYFFMPKRQAPFINPHSDTISFTDTPDSIVQKMKVYVANNPMEVMYLDSVWMQQDSTPMKQVMASMLQDTMSKQYSNLTLYLTCGNQYYDLELQKPDSTMPYNIELTVAPQNGDTLLVDGLIRPQKGDALHFQNLMLPLYKRFVITYNHKMPPPPEDSTAIQGHVPAKTVTVLSKV